MSIEQEHMVGVAIDATAAGYYCYRKHQAQVDGFLKEHGIDIRSPATIDAGSLALEQRVAERQRLESLIAEDQLVMCSARARMDHPKPRSGQRRAASGFVSPTA